MDLSARTCLIRKIINAKLNKTSNVGMKRKIITQGDFF